MEIPAPRGDEARTVVSQICETIKAQIAEGVYRPGSRLPSSRALATELGVSRTTVTAAYEQLAAEGYLETRQGTRSRVPMGLRVDRPAKSRDAKHPPVLLSDFGRRLVDLPADDYSRSDALVADFRYGDLAAADFPTLRWKRAIDAAILRRPSRLQYGEPAGSRELRSALQGYLWRGRGLRCDPEQIMVVNGSQQGLDLCVRLLLNPGEPVIIENPCYGAARDVLVATGARLIPREVDREGMRVDRLPPARLAYVTPSHQFPLGSVMSARRRQDLLAWARQCNAYVIEDDYDGEYRFDIAPIPTLQTLDGARNVIYLGTVSKTLSPTLRLGYLVVPQALSATFRAAKRLADRHTPTLEQEALKDLIISGAYERHVRRARRQNGTRRTNLLRALQSHLGDQIRVVGAEAGLHVVVWFTRFSIDQEAMLVATARSAGVGVYPITPLYAPSSPYDRPDHPGLVMGYASLDDREITRGIKRLSTALEVFAPNSPTARSAGVGAHQE